MKTEQNSQNRQNSQNNPNSQPVEVTETTAGTEPPSPLPPSILTKRQVKTVTKTYTEHGIPHIMDIKIRYDDECHNGHNTFGITATIWQRSRTDRNCIGGGCYHEEISKRAPELAHLIKWHGCTSEGPLYYIENTLYLAGDKDYNGLRAGEPDGWGYGIRFNDVPIIHEIKKGFFEFLQNRLNTGGFQVIGIPYKPTRPGEYKFKPHYTFVGYNDTEWAGCPFNNLEDADRFKKALETCKAEFLRYPTSWSEGKARELDAARRAAIWPEATDEQLTSGNLEKALKDRLPALMADFKKAMEEQGFIY